jgi:DNA-binding MarR family transcriptional regulator
MEHTFRLASRQQLFLDLVSQISEADTDSIETYLYFLWVAGDIFAQQQAFFGRYDLSEGKLVVLQLLHQAPQSRLTPTALAEAANVTRGTMTGLLAGLERSGLVKRTQHPEDGRMFSIEPTEQAFDLLERILPESVQHIEALMSPPARKNSTSCVPCWRRWSVVCLPSTVCETSIQCTQTLFHQKPFFRARRIAGPWKRSSALRPPEVMS